MQPNPSSVFIPRCPARFQTHLLVKRNRYCVQSWLMVFVFLAGLTPLLFADQTTVPAAQVATGAQATPANQSPTTPGDTTASTTPSDRNFIMHQGYQTQLEDYLFTMKGKPCDLIFIGDSITEQWRWGSGKSVWDKYYRERALDFGLGSDKTQDTIWRLNNLPLTGFSPKVAVILIGTNNFKDTPEEIAAGVQGVINATKLKFPGIRIILLSILPNARATEKMAAANLLIQKYADDKEIYFLDLAAKFTPEGDNWKGLGRDKLHLTTQGYETWAAELNQLLAKVSQ